MPVSGRVVGAALIAAMLTASGLSAQQCVAPARPFFDFQVDTPAEFIPDSAAGPSPARSSGPAGNELALVQFLVDSLGVPDPRTYKVLTARDPALAAAGRDAMRRWRFRPAMLRGCRVVQLVQTPLAP